MHYFQNRYAYRTKPFLNLHFFLQPPPLPPKIAPPVTPPCSCCRPAPLPLSRRPAPVAALPRSPCHVTLLLLPPCPAPPVMLSGAKRSRNISRLEHLPLGRSFGCALRAPLRMTEKERSPASTAALPRSPCHVERSEAESKHLTIRTHLLREILRLRPAGSAQDDRKRPSE